MTGRDTEIAFGWVRFFGFRLLIFWFLIDETIASTHHIDNNAGVYYY
jgi:hypothetical protein